MSILRSKIFRIAALLLGVPSLAPRHSAGGAARFETAGSVIRLHPGLDAIVPPDARIEKVATGFTWTEGPLWTHQGYLLFADIPGNRIMKWTPDGALAVFMQPSGYTGGEPFKGPEAGSNGMTLDRRGRLVIAQHAGRKVVRLESLAPGAPLTVLAERYQGKRLNSPNDLVYRSDGSLYFTDPPYGLPTQSDSDPQKELPFNGVFRIPGALTHRAGAPPDDARLQLLIRDLPRPNGIAFSPDEKYLYVDNSEGSRKIWMRYEVKPDGSVANGRLFYDATSDTSAGGPDGMKVDRKGNVYGAGPAGVWIFSPDGEHLGTLKMPEVVANCHWGDADGRTLYITASTSVYRIRLKIPGVRP
jgi:gluconolactonase